MGAESIGVATGGFTVEQLRASGATHVFETLADVRAIPAMLAVSR
jgi:phosphoglycolate phosphatase-like HAD superfamily hydrolase